PPRSALFPYTTLFRSALGDQVEPVVEELAEQSEDRVVGRRIPNVRRNVRQQDGRAIHLDAVVFERGIQEGLLAGVALRVRVEIRSEEHTSELQSRENL